MGTRGLQVYKFRGRYYVFYNQYDSYPEGLGTELVQAIPSGQTAEFQSWLSSRRQEYEEIEAEVDECVWTISLEALERAVFSSSKLEIQLPQASKLNLLPSAWPPANDLMIEWVYTFDLDREFFSVNNHEHFPLNNIPMDWIDLSSHGHEYRTIFDFHGPERENGQVSLELPPLPAAQALVLAYSRLHSSIIRPKSMEHFLPGKRSAVHFAKRLHIQWVKGVYEALDYMIPQWESSCPVFRELAFATLCLAAGFPDCVAFGNMSALRGNRENAVFGVPTGVGPESPVELVSDICSGFHLPGESPWHAPSDEFFWMQGVLVHLCLNLHLPEFAKASVSRLVQEGKSSGKDSFHGVVMSLEHVILIRVSPGDHVEHTQLLELIAYPYEDEEDESTETGASDDKGPTKDPEREEENLKDLQEKERGDLKAETIQNNCPLNKSNQDVQNCMPDLNEKFGGLKVNKPFSLDRESDAFAGLAHVFEAVKLEKLCNKPNNRGRLPLELYHKIIDQADYPTWLQCMDVSRAFRYHCQRKWILNHDLAVLNDDGDKCHLRVPKEGEDGSVNCPFNPVPGLERLNERPFWRAESVEGTRWIPIVGYERGKRMALAGSGFVFQDYTPSSVDTGLMV